MTTRRRYVTVRRVDQAVAQLDDVDFAVLETVRLLRVATGLQLQHLHHGLDDPAKQRRVRQLARLSRGRFLVRLDRRVGGPGGGSFSAVYTLGVAGRRLLFPEDVRPRHPWTPSSPHLAHALAVTELYVDLRRAEASGAFSLEHFETEPACWRDYRDRHGRHITLKPDAHLVVATEADELHWFVEIDLATETGPRIAKKGQLFIDYWNSGIEEEDDGVFPLVAWVSPDLARVQKLAKALGTLDEDDRLLFRVCTFDQAVNVITGAEDGVQP